MGINTYYSIFVGTIRQRLGSTEKTGTILPKNLIHIYRNSSQQQNIK